jgi:hypothetical protein
MTASRIRAFQVILALVLCAEYWIKSLARWHDLDVAGRFPVLAATLLCVATLWGRRRRAIFAGFVILEAWYVWSRFPLTGNHRFLGLFLAGLFAVLDAENDEEGPLLLQSVQWTAIVVLFYSGVQKLAHGYYFRGQFLAYSLSRDSFRTALAPLVSAEEVARLTSYSGAVGDGPYLASGLGFLLVANAVWVLEVGLALLLLFRPTRGAAWIAACAFVVLTQLVAREFLFGIEFVCALLLFARGDVVRRAVWPVAVLLGLLVLVRLGVLPEMIFH